MMSRKELDKEIETLDGVRAGIWIAIIVTAIIWATTPVFDEPPTKPVQMELTNKILVVIYS